jgi:cell wall-associated NlpC family hydrolase
VVAAARRWLGTPYSWGGGDLTGPSVGFAQGAGTIGFDCSSLARYAWYQATSGTVLLPRVTSDQAATGPLLPPGSALAAGDLMFFHDPADPLGIYHHVGIYAGGGAMIHAPHTGAFVELVPNVLSDGYFRSQFAGALRPIGG